MAMYSVELRRYIKNYSQYENPRASVKEKIEVGQPHLFDFEYPFFDETKRKDFERKWIRRFYMTEIGFETIELFKFHLENWMNEKMPYYNQRFESELIKFDPLMNTIMDKTQDHTKDLTTRLDSKDNGDFETHTASDGESSSESTGNMISDGTVDQNGTSKNDESGTKNGNNKNVNDGSSFSRNVIADTPDKRLEITTDDGKGILKYASKIDENTGKTHNDETITIDEDTTKNQNGVTTDKSVSHDEANSKSNTNGETHEVGKATGVNSLTGVRDGKNNEIGNQKEHYLGKIGVETYSEMLQKYRDTFIRIESEIYEECRKDLFMLVY